MRRLRLQMISCWRWPSLLLSSNPTSIARHRTPFLDYKFPNSFTDTRLMVFCDGAPASAASAGVRHYASGPAFPALQPCGFTQQMLNELKKDIKKGDLDYVDYFFKASSIDELPKHLRASHQAQTLCDELDRCKKCGCTIDEHITTSVQPFAKPFDSSTFDPEQVVNTQINSKDQKAFEERDKIMELVYSHTHDASGCARSTNNKPTVITVISPRGTGKTSLVRQLALTKYREQMNCGRVQVIDCSEIERTWNKKDSSKEVNKVILRHLLHVFGGSSVTTAGEQVSFPRLHVYLSEIADASRQSFHPSFEKFHDTFMSYTGDGVVQCWKDLTAVTFAPSKDYTPILLLDSVENLCDEAGAGKHESSSEKTRFAWLMQDMPLNTPIVAVGTLNDKSLKIPTDASQFTTVPLGGLKALTLDGTKNMRGAWSSSLGDEDLEIVWQATCGVPRLLEFAFETKSTTSAREALILVKSKIESRYASGFDFADILGDEDLAKVVLSCCVGWKMKNATVPGTKVTWNDVRGTALVFPAQEDANRSVIPRFFLRGREKAMEMHFPTGVSIDDLYPDFTKLVGERGGTLTTGVPWEKLIACAFAARFHVHCLANQLPLTRSIPLSELYPSDDPHVQAVLEPYDVCLQDGIEYPADQVFADDSTKVKGNAIIANVMTKGAHHDLLLPVTRRKNGNRLFIAIQCRYGKAKDGGDMHPQSFVRKNSRKRVEVLLQCCSSKEGLQSFNNKRIKRLQEQKRYACIDGSAISVTGGLLQLKSL